MTAVIRGVAPLLLLLDNVRFLGPDGLILAASAAVLAVTWRTVRTVQPDAVAKPGSELVSVPAQRRSVFGYRLGRTGALATPNRATSLGLLLVGLLIAWAGLRLLAQPDAVRIGLLLTILGIGAVAWLDGQAVRAGAVAGSNADEWAESHERVGFWEVVLPKAKGNLRWLLTGLPIVCTLLVWRMNRARPLTDDHTDIALLWLLAIGATLAAVAWPIKRPDLALRAWFKAERGWLLIVSAVALLAGVLRLWNAGGYPWTYAGDEAQFGLEARRVLEGQIQNPFGTGFLSHPNLFFYLQAWSMEIFGEDVAGIRAISGLLGVAAVVVVMFYARHMFGPIEAIVAGVVLAILHHHIYLSRISLNNVGDALFLTLTLWLVDRGVFGRRRMSSLLAGMAIGWGQYFYFGSRLLPVIAAAVIVAGVLFRRDRSRAAIALRIRELAPYAALTLIGAIVVLTPYLAYYIDHSVEANGRMHQVSIFSSGWLDNEKEITGRGAVSIIVHRIWDILLLPFHGDIHGFYRPVAPYVGVVMAIPVALGLGIAVAGFWRRRYVGLVITYVAVAAGMAVTEGGLYQSNRYSGVVVLFSLLAAVGLCAVVRILTRLGRIHGQVVLGALAIAVGLIGAWNVHFFFRDSNQVALYSDPNTQVANTLAYELRAMEPGTTVYFAGPPRMWYGGFANIEFIAPEAIGITIEEPLSAADQPPEITGPTLFVFLPHRIDELDIVRAWFPGGDFNEVHDEDDLVLYYEYRVEPGQA